MTARLWAGFAVLGLSACAGPIVPRSVAQTTVTAPAAPKPATAPSGAAALAVGVTAGPEISALTITDDAARRAVASFQASCPAARRRNDLSGLTRNEDWARVCDLAGRTGPESAKAFFVEQFEHMLEPCDVALRLFEMVLESGAELFAGRCLGQLRQRLGQLFFGVVHIFDFIHERIAERVSGHVISPLHLRRHAT